MTPDLLAAVVTTGEAADMLGLSRSRVAELVAAGELRARRSAAVWLVLRADVETYQANRRRACVSCLVRAEDFDDTRDDHRGNVTQAAHRLGLKPRTLRQALYRARKRGWTGTYTDDTRGK